MNAAIDLWGIPALRQAALKTIGWVGRHAVHTFTSRMRRPQEPITKMRPPCGEKAVSRIRANSGRECPHRLSHIIRFTDGADLTGKFLKGRLFLQQAAFNKTALLGSQIRSQDPSVSNDILPVNELLRCFALQHHRSFSLAKLKSPPQRCFSSIPHCEAILHLGAVSWKCRSPRVPIKRLGSRGWTAHFPAPTRVLLPGASGAWLAVHDRQEFLEKSCFLRRRATTAGLTFIKRPKRNRSRISTPIGDMRWHASAGSRARLCARARDFSPRS